MHTGTGVHARQKKKFPLFASKGNIQEIVQYIIGQNFLDFQEILP